MGGKGMSFVNNGHSNDQKDQDNNNSQKDLKCFNCGIEEHYANQCNKLSKEKVENKRKEDQGMAICVTSAGLPEQNTNCTTFSSTQNNNRIPRTWVLIDNQSMIDLFCIPGL